MCAKPIEQSLSKTEQNVEFFSLCNVIALKLHERESDKRIFFYFINVHSNSTLKVECVEFQSYNQFKMKIYNHLKENLIFSTLDHEVILLKNIFLEKSPTKELNLGSNFFSSVSLVSASDRADDKITSLLDEDEAEDKSDFDSKIIRNIVAELLDDNIQNVQRFEFFQISGKIMDICEENCCFDFYCSSCMTNENLQPEVASVYLDYQKLDDNRHKLMFNVEKK